MIADEVEELLKDPTPEKARALLDKIPDLVPEDPALAPLLAEEMAKAYGEAFTKAQEGSAASAPSDAALANEITNPCPKCHHQLRADGGCTHCERDALLNGGLKRISPNQAKSVLSEPVTVSNPTGATFRFTKEKLLADDSHLKADHTEADFERRTRVMLYAIDAAKTSSDIENKRASRPNELGVYPQRKEVRKTYTDHETGKKFEVVVRADNNGEVYEVFDIFPR